MGGGVTHRNHVTDLHLEHSWLYLQHVPHTLQQGALLALQICQGTFSAACLRREAFIQQQWQILIFCYYESVASIWNAALLLSTTASKNKHLICQQSRNLQFNCRKIGLSNFRYQLNNLFGFKKGSFSLKWNLTFICRDMEQHLTFSALTSLHQYLSAVSAFCLHHQTVLRRY